MYINVDANSLQYIFERESTKTPPPPFPAVDARSPPWLVVAHKIIMLTGNRILDFGGFALNLFSMIYIYIYSYICII